MRNVPFQRSEAMSAARQQLLGGPGGGLYGIQPQGPGIGAGGGLISDSSTDSLTLELESMTTAQLEEMLTNEEAYKKFMAKWVSQTPAARALADIRARNAALARESMAMHSSLDEARNQVAIVKSSEYAAAKGVFEELVARQAVVLQKLAPAVLNEQLRLDVDKADDASGALQDALLAGTLPLEAFVEQYCAARVTFHTLDLKRQVAEHSLYTA